MLRNIIKFITIGAMLTIACQPQQTGLKDLMQDGRLIGGALNYWQVTGKDSIASVIVPKEFNTITPENLLKWERVHPQPDSFNFGPADQFVAYGKENDMFIVGHTLVWHAQTPRWVFQDDEGNPASPELLDQRLREHIQTVVGRYKGRIHAWDVVNEALTDNGELRPYAWYKILGEAAIEKAFIYAHEADPDAKLYYNDYDIWKPEKREGVIRIVKNLKDKGIQVDGIGLQGHWGFDWPDMDELEKSLIAYGELVDQVMITEVDMNMLPVAWDRIGADISKNFELNAELNPYTEGLPDSIQQKITDRYVELFTMFEKHKVYRVTFWGVTDAASWLNNWPVRGRTAYPLLWDRDGSAKPAYDAVAKVLGGN